MDITSLRVGQLYHTTSMVTFYRHPSGERQVIPPGTTLVLEATECEDYCHCVRVLGVVRCYRVLDGPMAGLLVRRYWIDSGSESWVDPPHGLSAIPPSPQDL